MTKIEKFSFMYYARNITLGFSQWFAAVFLLCDGHMTTSQAVGIKANQGSLAFKYVFEPLLNWAFYVTGIDEQKNHTQKNLPYKRPKGSYGAMLWDYREGNEARRVGPTH